MPTSAGVGQYAASEGHLAFFGRFARPDQSKRGVVYAHPHNAAYDWQLTTAGLADVPAALAYVGVPVITTDMGGLTTWGNDTSIARFTDSWSYLQTQFGAKTDKVIVMGLSMGALIGLLWAKANLASVAAIALFAPVLDLAYTHDNNIGAWATEIETAYGGSSAYNAAIATHNPATIAASFSGIPTKIWYSSNDPVAIPSAVTAFAAASGAATSSLGAIGHAITGLDATAVRAFLGPYV